MPERNSDLWSDSMPSDDMSECLPSWVQDVIAQPVASHDASRAAIMTRVRREPRPATSTRRIDPPMRMSRWTRRGLLSPFGAAAFAGVLGLMLSVRSISTLHMDRNVTGISATAAVIGDTVMPSLRDTMRIVEFVLRGPGVRNAAVVGDFNAWRRGVTTLERRSDGTWYGRVVVPRDVVRFSYVVNDGPTADARVVPDAGGLTPPERVRVRIDSI
jgi:hypothetical protein